MLHISEVSSLKKKQKLVEKMGNLAADQRKPIRIKGTKIIDIRNKRFGRITVLNKYKTSRYGKLLWLCKCDCGEYKYICSYSLRRGLTTSCGCFKVENQTKHGDYNSRLYQIWSDMKTRCSCKTNSNFKHYGGRGIYVCSSWRKYVNFRNWALKSGYLDSLTIERKNNSLGYNPDNCIFTTIQINNKNTRRTYFWFINGMKFNSSSDAAKHFNVSKDTIRYWCIKMNDNHYKTKENCYAIKKYGENK